jgi:hypothetical protein
MASDRIAQRRKIRELEAKRDRLTETTTKNKTEMAKVRAELKHLRKG